eukprot:1002041-Amphidinium_carterae.1
MSEWFRSRGGGLSEFPPKHTGGYAGKCIQQYRWFQPADVRFGSSSGQKRPFRVGGEREASASGAQYCSRKSAPHMVWLVQAIGLHSSSFERCSF